MSTRNADEAETWGRGQIHWPSRSWYRLCKMFVRMCFNVPSDGTPDAGRAWDNAKFKHNTSNPAAIPAGVPVYWELPSVADHVALSIGDGRCLSNDIFEAGKISECAIHTITSRWGGQLLGWTEDIDGVRVWEPEPEDEATPNITKFLQADNLQDRLKFLRRIQRHGEPDMARVAKRLETEYQERHSAANKIRELRKKLRRLEVKD